MNESGKFREHVTIFCSFVALQLLIKWPQKGSCCSFQICCLFSYVMTCIDVITAPACRSIHIVTKLHEDVRKLIEQDHHHQRDDYDIKHICVTPGHRFMPKLCMKQLSGAIMQQ